MLWRLCRHYGPPLSASHAEDAYSGHRRLVRGSISSELSGQIEASRPTNE